MIFSEEKWNNGAEIKDVFRTSAALSFQTVKVAFEAAYNTYIVPVIGSKLSTELVSIYDKINKTKTETAFLRSAQKANANLAFWSSYDEINSVISDNGIQQVKSENYGTLYKYQERNLRTSYREKGFNAIDEMLEIIYSDEVLYKDFPVPTEVHFISSATEIDKYVSLNKSRLTYLRLLPHIRYTEDIVLPSIIGEKVIAHVLEDKTESAGKAKKLIAPVVTFLACARLVEYSGEISDRGLYFSSVTASGGEDTETIVADRATSIARGRMYKDDAAQYGAIAKRELKILYPELFQDETPDQTGSNRKAFWT